MSLQVSYSECIRPVRQASFPNCSVAHNCEDAKRSQRANNCGTSLAQKSWSMLLCCCILVGCKGSAGHHDQIPIHEELSIDSVGIGERRAVNVYTPPNYYAESDSRYPVVYMPDGGLQEDFPHVANTIDSLIRSGALSPVILIGVENTDRKRDLTGKSQIEKNQKLIPNHGGSDNFRKFFRDELRPVVEKKYRCNGQSAILGESLAGLFVAETLILDPTMFDRYIAFDPSLWWNAAELVNSLESQLASNAYEGKHFWFASSDASDIVEPAKLLASILKSKADRSFSWHYAPCPDEKHSTIFRAKKEDALRWALWKP